MTIRVECPCSWSFDAADDLAGGLSNCPSCGRAAPVPGLRDPLWRLAQVGALLAAAAAGVVAGAAAGPVAGIAVAAGVAGACWLVSRLF